MEDSGVVGWGSNLSFLFEGLFHKGHTLAPSCPLASSELKGRDGGSQTPLLLLQLRHASVNGLQNQSAGQPALGRSHCPSSLA